MERSITICIVSLILFSTCASSGSFSERYKGQQLLFGKGGGFTGQQTTYMLSPDGLLKAKNGVGESFKTVNTISPETTLSLFERLNELNIGQIDLNQPGNIYYFIEQKKETKQHRLTWGKDGSQTPVKIKTLYKDLIALVSKKQ